MACKIFVNHPGSLSIEGVAALQKKVADHLGVCCEDVVVMPGITLSVVEVPDAMTAAREKADKHAAAEAVKAQKELEKQAERAAENEEKRAKAEAKAAKAAAAAGPDASGEPSAAARAANPPEGMGLPRLNEAGVPMTESAKKPAKSSPAKAHKKR